MMMNKYKNGNMYQKSLIQQITEFNEALEYFKKSINDIMETYTINGNVFSFRGGKLNEITSGYFIIESTHDNLQDAIRNINNFSKCIRVVENKKFQVGSITDKFSDIQDNDDVVDIES